MRSETACNASNSAHIIQICPQVQSGTTLIALVSGGPIGSGLVVTTLRSLHSDQTATHTHSSTNSMHRGEGAPYNPYPEEGGSPRRGHHHQHFDHHQAQDEPQYGSALEHRPPPPSRPEYGGPAPHGYGEGPYGQERRPEPYREQPQGGYEGKNSSQYPPRPNPYGSSANPASGHGYGDGSYHASPYAPAPNHSRSMAEEGEGPRRRQIPGLPVRLHCKADPNFSLAVVPGQGPVMVPTDPQDDYQVWYKDETMSTRVKDETGAPAFSLINKVTGEALRHPPEDLKQCLLAGYEPNGRDETMWWTMSEDMGHGYRCVRLATNTSRNLDVLRGDKKSGGVKQGLPVITFAWKKQDNQIWKMTPANCKRLPTSPSCLEQQRLDQSFCGTLPECLYESGSCFSCCAVCVQEGFEDGM